MIARFWVGYVTCLSCSSMIVLLSCVDQENSTESTVSQMASEQKGTEIEKQSSGADGTTQRPNRNSVGQSNSGQPSGRQKGPPGPPPNMSGAMMGHQSGMPQQQPFHAKVTFDWMGEATQTPLSVVWISLDTVNAARMSVYGGPAQVPNLQAFSEKAVVFEHAISHFPETALSHWAMMSSVLPEVHGNVPANGGSMYTGPTMADIAKAHRYTTVGCIGGVTMTDQASGFGRGFDVYDDKFPLKIEDMSRDGLEVTRCALQGLAEQAGTYFIFAHYFDAHFPYTPTQNVYDPDYVGELDGTDAVLRPYRDGQKEPSVRDVEHIRALYDAEITELDTKIAPLLALASPSTLVVVTADHGESFSHGYYFNHRAGLWDEVTHVPLLIAGGEISAKRISQQIGLIDVLPTVLDLAGLPKDRRFMGSSRLNWLQSNATQVDLNDDVVFSITDPWMPQPQFAARTNAFKSIYTANEALHYDLRTDSQEIQSLNEPIGRLKDIRKAYDAQIASMTKWQSESPRKRQISDEECKRLMALGYTTCEQ